MHFQPQENTAEKLRYMMTSAHQCGMRKVLACCEYCSPLTTQGSSVQYAACSFKILIRAIDCLRQKSYRHALLSPEKFLSLP